VSGLNDSGEDTDVVVLEMRAENALRSNIIDKLPEGQNCAVHVHDRLENPAVFSSRGWWIIRRRIIAWRNRRWEKRLVRFEGGVMSESNGAEGIKR
jgi:hypothetical protein